MAGKGSVISWLQSHNSFLQCSVFGFWCVLFHNIFKGSVSRTLFNNEEVKAQRDACLRADSKSYLLNFHVES